MRRSVRSIYARRRGHNRSGHMSTLIGLFCLMVTFVYGMVIFRSLGWSRFFWPVVGIGCAIFSAWIVFEIILDALSLKAKRVAAEKRLAAMSPSEREDANDPSYQRYLQLHQRLSPDSPKPTRQQFYETLMSVGTR